MTCSSELWLGQGKILDRISRAQTWAILTQTLRDDKLPTGHWLRWQEGQLSPPTHGSLVLPQKRHVITLPPTHVWGFPSASSFFSPSKFSLSSPISIICSSQKQKNSFSKLASKSCFLTLSSDTYKRLLPLHLRFIGAASKVMTWAHRSEHWRREKPSGHESETLVGLVRVGTMQERQR